LINDIPVQVKANIIYRGNHNRVNEHLERIQEIIQMSLAGSLTLQYIENEIIKFIRVDYLDQIRKAIEQKARIVFIDGTQSAVGFALNKWASYHDNNRFSFEKSLSAALVLHETHSNVFPVIFAACAFDYNYRLSSICLRIPIVKTENEFAIDDDNLELINLI
jgi:hypothetical protein